MRRTLSPLALHRRLASAAIRQRHEPERRTAGWLNSQELAEVVRVANRQAARQWAARRGIVPVTDGGRRLLYSVVDVERCLSPHVPKGRTAAA